MNAVCGQWQQEATEYIKPAQKAELAERQRKAAERERIKPLTNKVKKLTGRIEQLEAERDRLEKRLADADLYQPDKAEQLKKLLAESGSVKQQLESLEGEWLAVEEELEALRAG